MTPVKDEKTGKWFIQFWYKDSFGENKKTTRRGFSSKRDAIDWYMNFKLSQKGNLNMKFSNFVNIYINDMQNKIREHTWISKRQIIDTKIMPYFKDKKICDISTSDIIKWQNEVQKLTNKQLIALHNEFQRLNNCSQITDEQLILLNQIMKILNEMRFEND